MHTFEPPDADAENIPDEKKEFVYFYGRSQAEIDANANGLSSSAASLGLTVRPLERGMADRAAADVDKLIAHKGSVDVDMNTLRRAREHANATRGRLFSGRATRSGNTAVETLRHWRAPRARGTRQGGDTGQPDHRHYRQRHRYS